MKEIWVSGDKPKTSRVSKVVGKVNTVENSDDGRDRLCRGMHSAKHEVFEQLSGACATAGNLACQRVLQSSFIMPSKTSAEITFRCEQFLSNEGSEFPPCALAGDTEINPRSVVRVALSRIDAE